MLKMILFPILVVTLCLSASAQLRMAGGGIGGSCQATALSGATLCAGEGPTLSVFDVSVPSSPQVLSRLRLAGTIESIAIRGNRAFAACGARGVHIIDLSSPASPALIGTIPSASHSYAAAAATGNLVLVADGGAGLRLVNITNPAAPVTEGTLATTGPARDVIVQGNLAYVLDYHLGLLIVDISAAPTLLGSVETLPFGRDIQLFGSTVLLVDEVGLFALIEVAVPSEPTITGIAQLTGPARAIRAEGSFAFAALGAAGVQPVNISTPAAPAPATPLALPGEAFDLITSGSTAYVADGFGGLRILDISAPAAPVEIAAVQHGTRAGKMIAADGILYVAAGEEGLKTYSLSAPERPVLLGSCATGGNARDLALSGDMLYVADDIYGLSVVSAVDPMAPVMLESLTADALTAVRTIAVEGALLAASDGHRVQLLDSRVPAGSFDVDGTVFDLAFYGDLLLVAAGHAGLWVVDVSNSVSPSMIGILDTQGAVLSVTVSGGEVYLVDDESGSLRVDLSDPSAPLPGVTLASGSGMRDVAVTADTAVSAGNALARSTDITPATPVALDTFTKLVRAMQLAVSGSFLLVAEEESGVAILSLDVALDSDGDQMPDSWEQQIADADPNDGIETIEEVVANDDFDGDALSNAHEFIAGTDPTNAGSIFAQIAPARGEIGGFAVQWYSVAGKRYTVHKSTNLANGFAPVATDLTATPPVNQYTDIGHLGESAFYMVSVQQ